MRNRTLIIASMLATLACASDSIAGPNNLTVAGGPQAAASEKLDGYVEVYSATDVRLLTGGIEVQLFGAIDAVAAFAGLHVVVSGRYIAQNDFWVESVWAPDEVVSQGEPAR